MPHDLPEWVAELTDPRRAGTPDELADRLVPLAEHALDVSRRMQTQFGELSAPFEHDALAARTRGLETRMNQALAEVAAEFTASGAECVDRIVAGLAGPDGSGSAELRRRLDRDVVPVLAERRREIAGRIADRAAAALEEAVLVLLGRVAELAGAVNGLVGDALPLAREGLTLSRRLSALADRARTAGGGPVPGDLRDEAAELARVFDETVARLELEWSALGARAATVRAAMRAAEEAAFGHITRQVTRYVAELAPAHAQALNEAETAARTLATEN